jgi:hypothetical protein
MSRVSQAPTFGSTLNVTENILDLINACLNFCYRG